MSRLVVINLGSGNLQRGCPNVTAQISQKSGTHYPIQFSGSLPPAPEIDSLYRRWQLFYKEFYRSRSRRSSQAPGAKSQATELSSHSTRKLEIQAGGITHFSEIEFRDLSQQLKSQINVWLKTEAFLGIDQRVRAQLDPIEEIRVIVETNDYCLQRLPWYAWDFFNDYRRAEVALGSPDYWHRELLRPKALRKQVRILAILGNSKGIDLEAECEFLKGLRDAEVQFLVKPNRRDFNSQLWNKAGWDILFFAGHSQTEGESGRIYINEDESNNSLTIEELEEALNAAIEHGLRLAIFNSCEGLGLANALAKLDIPQVIVMREPVPNLVAQEFFRHFLEAFAGQHLSLYLAAQEARRKLQGLEDAFPAASWLPVICQNPALEPPTWSQLGGLPACPYRGLSSFREEDAPFFNGREAFTEKLVLAVKRKPLVPVIGASGSGKSSVVFAGLLPRLRASMPVKIAAFRLGHSPFEALAAAIAPLGPQQQATTQLGDERELATTLRHDVHALHRLVETLVRSNPGTRLVLVADQFEELYTLCPAAECRPFLDSLLQAVNRAPAFTLVLTLRADFFGRALAYPSFGEALQAYPPELLLPMGPEALERAIARPAAAMKVQLEKGLTQRIIDDVSDQPGHLPLLEFALTQLWEKQTNGWLTHRAYAEIGGVEEALANHAEAVYAQLGEADRQRAQRIFIQLVDPGEGTEDTRRLATRDEVQEDNWNLVMRLADARLVVTSRSEATGIETVEIVHEALIRSWGRLAQWMRVDGEFRRWQEQLRTALRQWESSGRDEGALLRGKPLTDTEEWQQRRQEELSDPERVFIQLSLEQRERQRKREKHRQQWTTSALTAGLVLAVSLAGIAWLQTRKALVSEVKAVSTLSEALFASDRRLDALIEAIRARKKLQQLLWRDRDIQAQVEQVLQQAIYGADEYNRLSGHGAGATRVAFSPDGSVIASVSDDNTIKLWQRDGTLLQTFSGHSDEVWGIAFSPDGQMLASASNDKTAKLWQRDGTLLRTFEEHSDEVDGISFSPDGQMLVSVSDDNTAKVWKPDGTVLRTLSGHSDEVEEAVFSPDGQMIATVSLDRTVKLWQRDGTLLRTLSGHGDVIKDVAFSPDGQTLVTAGWDRTAKLWSVDGTVLSTLRGHQAAVEGVAFSPDGEMIATASWDRTVKLWKPDGTLLTTLKGHREAVFGVAFSPDGSVVASASDDKTVKLWQPDGTLLTTLKGHNDEIRDVAISPDSQMIASAGEDRSVKLWQPDGTLLVTLKGHSSEIWGVAIGPDGQTIASASRDETVKLWQPDGTLLTTLKGHDNGVKGAAFSPDGEMIATASWDNTVKLWQPDGTLLRTLKGHGDKVNGVAFSPDGPMLASASDDNTVKLWQPDGTLLTTLKGHDDEVLGVAFSPDGQMLASASDDSTIKLWQPDGTLLHTMRGHGAGVEGVAFSPDGQMLASASDDNTIKLWQPDGTLLTTLNGHNDEVKGVAFSPDGQMIVSVSGDKQVIIWDLDRVLDLDNLLAHGCDWVRDYLRTNPNVRESDRHLCAGIQVQ